jgi:uncharacterized protein
MPDPWYSEGLRFSCTQCGNCCTGPPGYVVFDPRELGEMAAYLKLSPAEFLVRYARPFEGGWSLVEVQRDGMYDCVFLKADPATGRRGCSIYPVRPVQCRTWPFWPDNLRSRKAYAATAKRTPCPGMSKGLEGEGTFYPVEQIRIQRNATPH